MSAVTNKEDRRATQNGVFLGRHGQQNDAYTPCCTTPHAAPAYTRLQAPLSFVVVFATGQQSARVGTRSTAHQPTRRTDKHTRRQHERHVCTQEKAAAAVTGTRCCHKPHATHTLAQLKGTQKVMSLTSYNYQAAKAGARAPQPGAPTPCKPHCAVMPLALFFSHTHPPAANCQPQQPLLLPARKHTLPAAHLPVQANRCCCLLY
jgi:hypothetical protein